MSTYSFLDFSATLTGPGGVISLGAGAGAAEEGCTVAMVEEKDTTTPGADGRLMHSLHAANVGTITLRLQKTSPVNAALSAMYNFQRQSSTLWGQNVLVVSDVARGDVVVGSLMAFTKQPDVVWAKDGNTNEWVFRGDVIEQLGTGVPDVNA